MHLYYLLPHKQFFRTVPGGRVTHALGLANGFDDNGLKTCLISETHILDYSDRINSQVTIQSIPDRYYLFTLIRQFLSLASTSRSHIVLVRNNYLFIFLTRILSLVFPSITNCCVELNGFGIEFKRLPFPRLLVFLSESLTKLLLGKFALIYSVNLDITRRLTTGLFPISPTKVVTVPNGGPPQRHIDWEQKVSPIINYVYYGVFSDLYDYHDIVNSLIAASTVSNIPIAITFIGFGKNLSLIKKLDSQCSCVSYAGKMSPDQFHTYCLESDQKIVGLLPIHSFSTDSFISPIKTFEYMSLGIPLLYPTSTNRLLLEDNVTSLAYDPNDPTTIRHKLLQLSNEPRLYLRMSRAISAIYLNHTWTSRAALLAEHMTKHLLFT